MMEREKEEKFAQHRLFSYRITEKSEENQEVTFAFTVFIILVPLLCR